METWDLNSCSWRAWTFSVHSLLLLSCYTPMFGFFFPLFILIRYILFIPRLPFYKNLLTIIYYTIHHSWSHHKHSQYLLHLSGYGTRSHSTLRMLIWTILPCAIQSKLTLNLTINPTNLHPDEGRDIFPLWCTWGKRCKVL